MKNLVESLGRIMKGRSVSMEVKRDLRNTVIVPTLTYASETWVWNESQRSKSVGRSVSMEVKRDLRNTVIVPTLIYASKT